MSMILGVGPALGFFLVPVIGRASDRCRSRYGRRRPFMLLLSILLIVSLFVIPYAEAICSHLFGRSNELTSTLSVSTMVVGSILLDFSCQTCLTPCEALLSDLRYKGYSFCHINQCTWQLETMTSFSELRSRVDQFHFLNFQFGLIGNRGKTQVLVRFRFWVAYLPKTYFWS